MPFDNKKSRPINNGRIDELIQKRIKMFYKLAMLHTDSKGDGYYTREQEQKHALK